MKLWQVGAAGALIFILGCGGMGAYVPDQAQGNGTPLQCADLSLSIPSTMQVVQGSTSTETFTIINGDVDSLQSRAPGDATVSLSISGLPNGVTATFNPNPVTVGLDSFENVEITFDASIAQQGSSYNLTITATESGCTPVTGVTSLSVPSD